MTEPNSFDAFDAPDDFDGDGFADDPEFDGTEQASPLVGEAVRLFGVVQDWAKQTFPAPPNGHGGPECQWCPLCQFAAVLRGERPEVTERVAEAGGALLSAMKAFADAAASATPGPAKGRPKPGPGRVQPIDLDEFDQDEPGDLDGDEPSA